MASSARSKEPEARMRPAMMIPDSCRKTDSMVARRSAIYAADKLCTRGGLSFRADGTHFHAALAASAVGRNLRRPFQRFVKIGAVENVIAGKLFLGLSERTVCHHCFPVLHPHRGGGTTGFERLRAAQDPPPRRLRHDFAMLGRNLPHLFRR